MRIISWSGCTRSIAAPPFLLCFHIVNSLVPAPANGNLSVCFRLIVEPLLLNSMIIDTVFESPERTLATNCMSQFLAGRAGRQGFNETLHNAVLVNIVFCRESQKSAPWRVFNQFLQFFITFASDDLVLQINRFASLCVIEISKRIIGGFKNDMLPLK